MAIDIRYIRYMLSMINYFQMPPPDYSTVYQQKLEEINQFRRELQVEYQAEYERALVEVKEDLTEKEGPDLTENMKDEIRDWFNKEK